MPPELSTVHGDQTVEDLKRELAAAREQQAATSDILRVIGETQTDIQSVFDTIITNAVRLCGAYMGVVFRFDGELVHFVAQHNYPPKAIEILRRMYPRPPLPDQVSGRAILARSVAQIEDMLADQLYHREQARAGDWRSILAVPMLREGVPIGAIVIARSEVGSFPEGHIELLKTFANQAVIAIENTRLFEAEQTSKRELQGSLEYQTATSEVLNVISRSPSEVQPVFDVIARSSSRLCGDEHAIVTRYDGRLVHLVAQYNPRPGAYAETARIYPLPADPRASVAVRAVVTSTIVHIPNIEGEDYEPSTLERYRRMSARAFLAVPIMHQGRPIGSVSVSRATVGPFSNRQINLLKTFADQAVIAIENTRLFEAEQASKRELQESLEQQTATSEVLGVISRSPGELGPVFDFMLANATKLCEASYGAMWLREGDAFRNAAFHGALAAEYMSQWRNSVLRPDPDIPLVRVAQSRNPVHISDMREEHAYLKGHPLAVAAVDVAGVRTMVVVPMLKEDELVGIIAIYRKEVRQFTDKQIDLVTNFSKQAVIAIENTRLLNELRESLQQQTATADVLSSAARRSISSQCCKRSLNRLPGFATPITPQ